MADNVVTYRVVVKEVVNRYATVTAAVGTSSPCPTGL